MVGENVGDSVVGENDGVSVGENDGVLVGENVGENVGESVVGEKLGESVIICDTIEQSLPIYPGLHVQSQPSFRLESVVMPLPLQSLAE